MSSIAPSNPIASPLNAADAIQKDMLSTGIKYALAAQLPNFMLTLMSKFTGGELLTDRYANRIFQQAPLLVSAHVKEMKGVLAGQSDEFYQQTGQAVVDIGKQFLAGHIATSGWTHVDNLINQLSGSGGIFSPVVKALATPLLNNVKTDLEKQLQVDGSGPNFLLQTADTARNALIPLIDTYDPTSLIGGDNSAEKALLIAGLKTAAITTLSTPAVPQLLGRLLQSQLSTEQFPITLELIQSFLPQSGIAGTLVKGIVNDTLTQLQQEVSTLEARPPGELKATLETLSKQFISHTLSNNTWDSADAYIDTALAQLPPTLIPVGKQIWEAIKPDIVAYANATDTTDNAVDQLLSAVQQIGQGYIGQIGWAAVDTFVQQKIASAVSNTSNAAAKTQAGEALWQQIKVELENVFNVDQHNRGDPAFVSAATMTLGGLVAQLLSKPNVANSIGQLSSGQTQAKQASDPFDFLLQNQMTQFVSQLFGKSDADNAPGVLSLVSVVTTLASGTKEGMLSAMRSYLTGQGFKTIDDYLITLPQAKLHNALQALPTPHSEAVKTAEQDLAMLEALIKDPNQQPDAIISYIDAKVVIAETIAQFKQSQTTEIATLQARQPQMELTRILVEQLKAQLITELFGSAEEFASQHAENKDNAQSILLDMYLRSTLELPDDRPKGWMDMGWLAAGASTNATIAATQAVSTAAFDASKAAGSMILEASQAAASSAAAAVSYLSSAVWSLFGTADEDKNRHDIDVGPVNEDINKQRPTDAFQGVLSEENDEEL